MEGYPHLSVVEGDSLTEGSIAKYTTARKEHRERRTRRRTLFEVLDSPLIAL
jgi:hypothetical protein